MSQIFHPTPVSIRDIPIWLRETWLLLARSPVTFIALSLLYYFLAYCARSLAPFALLFAILLGQIFLSVSIVVAEAADNSRKIPIIPTYRMVKNILWIELLLSIVFLVMFVISHIVGSLIAVSLPATGHTHSSLFPILKWIWPGQVAFIALYVGIVYMWFVPPLISLHNLGIRTAFRLSRTAEDKSEGVIFLASVVPFLAFVALMMHTDFSLAIAIPFAPFFAIYQYVVYRHVFHGRKQNRKLVTQAAKVSKVPASVVTNQT